MGLRVFILLLAWVVVASLSWADLSGLHAETNGALADLQQATEPDLDELRDDAPTILATDEGLTASLSPPSFFECFAVPHFYGRRMVSDSRAPFQTFHLSTITRHTSFHRVRPAT